MGNTLSEVERGLEILCTGAVSHIGFNSYYRIGTLEAGATACQAVHCDR